MAVLQRVIEKVEQLQNALMEAEAEQEKLTRQADVTQKRLGRAAKLTSALAEEGVRWREMASQLQVGGFCAVSGSTFLPCFQVPCILYLTLLEGINGLSNRIGIGFYFRSNPISRRHGYGLHNAFTEYGIFNLDQETFSSVFPWGFKFVCY